MRRVVLCEMIRPINKNRPDKQRMVPILGKIGPLRKNGAYYLAQ